MDDAADDLRALVRLLTARGDSGDNPSGGGSNSGSIVKAHSARLADAGEFFCISVWAILPTRVFFTGAGVDVDAHLADARARLAQNGAHGNRTPDPPDHYAALGLIRPDAPDHGQRVSAIEAGAYILLVILVSAIGLMTSCFVQLLLQATFAGRTGLWRSVTTPTSRSTRCPLSILHWRFRAC